MKLLKIFFAVGTLLSAAALQADALYWQVGTGNGSVLDAIPSGSYNAAKVFAYTGSFVGGGTELFLYDETSVTSVTMAGVDSSADGSGIQIADLGAYGSSTYSFYIELGNYNNGKWTGAGHSEGISYDNLVSSGYVSTSGISMPAVGAWSGGSYAVPEPTSGLLLLIGGALLALRRRREA